MEQLRFEIRHADGRLETTVVHAPRIVIGSGAHCEVRLAADQAGFEHVAIESHLEGTFVRCLSTSPPALVGGHRFDAFELPETGTSIGISATRVRVTRAESAKTTRRTRRPFVAITLAAAIVAVGAAVWPCDSEPPSAAPLKMPELFSTGAATCPRADVREARALADDLRARAEGARERSPFDPREAIAAVENYEQAAACYRVGGALGPADEASETATRMREVTRVEFRARSIRLERLRLTKDDELAAQDVGVLRALTENVHGEYPRWLAGVAKEIKNQRTESGR